jgi:hypothetical protein
MKKLIFLSIIIIISAFIFTIGCNGAEDDDKDTDSGENGKDNGGNRTVKTFEADEDTFKGYRDWEEIDYLITDTTGFLGQAHMGQNENYARTVYINKKDMKDEEYKVGTVLVKETFTYSESREKMFADKGGITAMVKREMSDGEFNPDGGGWEWFIINPDDMSIVGRGADLGACSDCHGKAKQDYVFEHPAEFIAEEEDFTDYKEWTMTGEETGEHPALGKAHGGSDAVRRIYQKQAKANPMESDMGYPIGTLIVKESELNGEIVAITAMAKRGNDFNPEHGYWEWFMINKDDMSFANRGADFGACNSCHAKAKGNLGIDYVFAHDGALFNN